MVKLFHFIRIHMYILFAEWRHNRLPKRRRRWQALRVLGGGVVPLGKINQEKAIEKTSKIGSIVFVDTECAVIMYRDKEQ